MPRAAALQVWMIKNGHPDRGHQLAAVTGAVLLAGEKSLAVFVCLLAHQLITSPDPAPP
jgi:hypothetical protein